MFDEIYIAIYLQTVSIFVVVVAAALPTLIAIVGWVFIKVFQKELTTIPMKSINCGIKLKHCH